MQTQENKYETSNYTIASSSIPLDNGAMDRLTIITRKSDNRRKITDFHMTADRTANLDAFCDNLFRHYETEQEYTDRHTTLCNDY